MKSTYGWTKAGACKILEEEGAQVRILLPGRKRAQLVSKTHLLPVPATLRLIKKADFDQDCGCTAMLEVNGKTVDVFNVYGSLRKYIASGVKSGLDTTAHKRRVHLAEKGFVRALGSRRTASNVSEIVYGFQRKGYRIMEAEKVAEKVAEAVAS